MLTHAQWRDFLSLEEDNRVKLPPVRKASFKLQTEDALILLHKDGVLKYLQQFGDTNCWLCMPMQGMMWGGVVEAPLFLGQGWRMGGQWKRHP